MNHVFTLIVDSDSLTKTLSYSVRQELNQA
jgi:hypothetical protein